MQATEIDPKTIATLKARAALVGVVLHVAESDRSPLFTASKWNLVRELSSVAELEQFLQRLGSTP
jgi:hypothetical protein